LIQTFFFCGHYLCHSSLFFLQLDVLLCGTYNCGGVLDSHRYIASTYVVL
jgi:hypothetical protein